MSTTSQTVEDVETELLRLSNEKDALRERMKELTVLRDRLAAERAAETEVAAMDPARRDAIVKVAAIRAHAKHRQPE